MAYFQDTEYALLGTLLSHLQNRNVLDVGAEKGSFVEACLDAGSPRVFAFEPYAPHVAELRKKFAGVPAVTVFDFAIAAADQPMTLHIAHDPSGRVLDYHHSLIAFKDRRDVRWPSAIDVPCRSLDSLAAEGSIPRLVGLLKIDTEGGDMLVLEGARSIESAVVVVECWKGLPDSIGDSPYQAEDVVALMATRGYHDVVFVKRHDEFESLQVGSAHMRDSDWGNLVFIHEAVRADLMPVVYAASAAAADRLTDRALFFRQECHNRLAVIETLQDALSRGDRLATDAPQPWVSPPLEGEADRLRSGSPRVSVITPSFNQARFLEQAIRSVLDQGYPNLEYIIIDGGSTDGSVDIIRSYANRLAFWVSEPDDGQASAVNKGMAHVTGDIVGWVNSDDFYYPGAIQAAVEAFAADPLLGFVYGRGNRVNEHGALIEPFAFTRPFDLHALMHGIDYILQPTAFMRRGALAEVTPLHRMLRWTLDWDLWIRLGQKFPARMIDHLVAASREYASTKTSSGGFERMEEIRRVVRRHTGFAISVGYLNYLIYTLLDALPASRVPEQKRIERGLHHIAAVCSDLLREARVTEARGTARRLVRAIVPMRIRRVLARLIANARQRLR